MQASCFRVNTVQEVIAAINNPAIYSRDRLTLSILQFREDGVLDELKKKWWIEKSQCPVETAVKVGLKY